MTTFKPEVIEVTTDPFEDLDAALDGFSDMFVEGGADPATEDDTCAGGACKI